MTNVSVYSKKTEGSKYVQAHFQVKEFSCNDGSDPVFIDSNLARLLETIRMHFGKPVHINSGYRTVTYNKKVGGTTYSYHTKGMAADIHIKGVSPAEIVSYVRAELMRDWGGVGLYTTFVHIDTRTTKTSWTGK